MARDQSGPFGPTGAATPVSQHLDARGQYRSLFPAFQGSKDDQRALTRSFAMSGIGSIAGAVLWKEHRVWGFILGGMAGGAVGNLIFAPTTF